MTHWSYLNLATSSFHNIVYGQCGNHRTLQNLQFINHKDFDKLRRLYLLIILRMLIISFNTHFIQLNFTRKTKTNMFHSREGRRCLALIQTHLPYLFVERNATPLMYSKEYSQLKNKWFILLISYFSIKSSNWSHKSKDPLS